MNSGERPPAIVRWTLRLEQATALDRPVRALEPSIRSAFGTGTALRYCAASGWVTRSTPLLTNAVAISACAASWVARRKGRHGTGVRLALAGATVSGVGACLGGHLTETRKLASHHPAYDDTASEARTDTASGPARRR